MNRKSKKIWSALAVSLALSASFVSADNMMDSKNNSASSKGTLGVITPAVNPVTANGVNLDFSAEALCYRMTESNAPSVQQNSPAATYPTGSLGALRNGAYNNVNRDWDWGFRVNLGYVPDHDGWKVDATYTWFRTKQVRNFGAPNNTQAVVSQVASPNIDVSPWVGIVSQKMHSVSTAQLNQGDLRLGRNFFVSKWLALNPHFGARGFWFDRYYRLSPVTLTKDSATGVAGLTSVKTLVTNTYGAGGIFAGLDADFMFGDGWSMFATFDQAIVYGRSKSSRTEIDTAGIKYTRSNACNNANYARTITDLSVGLRWVYLFADDAARFSVQAAWEEHLFSNLNNGQLYPLSGGDVALTGVTFGVKFDF